MVENAMKFAIATITLARDKKEEAHLIRSISTLAHLGQRVFVADRSPNKQFKATLKSLGVTTLPGSSDLVTQTRMAVQAAARAASVVAYTEPDKTQFFEKRLGPLLESFERLKRETVLIPSRSGNSFSSYSKIQQRTEKALNVLCSNLFGVTGDYLYGPLIFKSSLAAHLSSVPEWFGWGWRLRLIKFAHSKGVQLCFSESDLACPPGQSKDTSKEWVHRMRQYSQNLMALFSDLKPTECRKAKSCFLYSESARFIRRND